MKFKFELQKNNIHLVTLKINLYGHPNHLLFARNTLRRPTLAALSQRYLLVLSILCLLISVNTLAEEEVKTPPKVGIDDSKLGTKLAMDLSFNDEKGRSVTLAQVANGKPLMLALVYYDCKSICNPFLHAIVNFMNNSPKQLLPGEHYNIAAISFNPEDGAKEAQDRMKAHFDMLNPNKKVPPTSWRFLTGSKENIDKLTAAVGFYYVKDGEDFNHPSALIVISPSGIISRYMRGLSFLPLDVMMAVTDASEGKWAPTIKKIVKFCFVKDPAGRGYYFDFLKVVGVIILFTIAVTVTVLSILINRKKKAKTAEV